MHQTYGEVRVPTVDAQSSLTGATTDRAGRYGRAEAAEVAEPALCAATCIFRFSRDPPGRVIPAAVQERGARDDNENRRPSATSIEPRSRDGVCLTGLSAFRRSRRSELGTARRLGAAFL